MFYIIYDSFTGQTKKFAESLGYSEVYSVKEISQLKDNSKVFLCTRSVGFGKVTEETKDFLKEAIQEKNIEIIGVAVSGNKNWGEELYGAAGRKISAKLNIPLVRIFEGSGFPSDREAVKQFLKEVEK